MAKIPGEVACPRCGKTAKWDPANPFRPFCSERCKMIDLGQWATDGYRIPVHEADSSTDGGAPENPPGLSRA